MKRLITAVVAFILPLTLLAQDSTKNAGYRDYTNAVLWQQHSGEYRALAFQAYNFAKLSLPQRLNEVKNSKKNCVVVDIDETVLDNSPFQGYEVKNKRIYDEGDWLKWTGKGIADTVPGALGFLKFAEGLQVETFYISNRGAVEIESTLKNLQVKGFPFADRAHLLFKAETSDKEARRQAVLKDYNILLLCGDNLSDFSNIFYREKRNTTEQVNENQEAFGTHFIVLPNPMYGDWEKLLYKESSKTGADRSNDRIGHLKSYSE